MTSITSVTLEDFSKKSTSATSERIEELKKWNASQPHMPKLEDSDLALFLHTNCYNMEMAMEHMQDFFAMRHYLPEFFGERDPTSEEMKDVMDTVAIVPLPRRTKDNYKVIIMRLVATDPTRYRFNPATKLMNMAIDMSVSEDGPNNEYIFIIDTKGTTMEHMKQLKMMDLKKFFRYLEKGAPIRFIGAHYVNSSPNKDQAVEDFVKDKIVNNKMLSTKLQYHPNLESLHEVVDKDILPDDMGGQGGSMAKMYQHLLKKLEAHQMFFQMFDQRFKLNKTKMTEPMVTKESLFGTEHNFESVM